MGTATDESEVERSPTFGERIQQFLDDDRKKAGGMTLGAMGRLGLSELREAVSLDSGNEASTPYGMYGTLTPGEVAAGRRDDQPDQQESSEMKAEIGGMTPGDIALDGSLYGQAREQGNGRDGDPPTPGDIAQENSTYTPDRESDRGQEMGRGR